ncbi:MAG: hypothetical protein WCA59_06980 [Candidatus Binataceae bacterium]
MIVEYIDPDMDRGKVRRFRSIASTFLVGLERYGASAATAASDIGRAAQGGCPANDRGAQVQC